MLRNDELTALARLIRHPDFSSMIHLLEQFEDQSYADLASTINNHEVFRHQGEIGMVRQIFKYLDDLDLFMAKSQANPNVDPAQGDM